MTENEARTCFRELYLAIDSLEREKHIDMVAWHRLMELTSRTALALLAKLDIADAAILPHWDAEMAQQNRIDRTEKIL